MFCWLNPVGCSVDASNIKTLVNSQFLPQIAAFLESFYIRADINFLKFPGVSHLLPDLLVPPQSIAYKPWNLWYPRRAAANWFLKAAEQDRFSVSQGLSWRQPWKLVHL